MIPDHYTDAQKAAYAKGRADSVMDTQATLSAGVRPMRDAAWCEGWAAAGATIDLGFLPDQPPADRPYAPTPAPLQAAAESRCDPCAAGEHGNCQGHTVSCWCPCSDTGAADGGRLG